MELRRITIASEIDTIKLAQTLAGILRPGDCVALCGDLGTGKTALARAIIRRLAGENMEVTSPTFALMQSYPLEESTLWHCDFYRLKDAQEARALGLDELWEGNIVLIEWPEVAAELLPDSRLEVALEYGAQEGARAIRIHGNEAWQKRLKDIV